MGVPGVRTHKVRKKKSTVNDGVIEAFRLLPFEVKIQLANEVFQAMIHNHCLEFSRGDIVAFKNAKRGRYMIYPMNHPSIEDETFNPQFTVIKVFAPYNHWGWTVSLKSLDDPNISINPVPFENLRKWEE